MWNQPSRIERGVTGRETHPPLLYLCEADVAALLPSPCDAVALARRALVALADGRAELPPKPAVHPRPDAFANAMPAYVEDGDLLGLKWVAIHPGNPSQHGLPTINGLVILADAGIGLPLAVMDAGALTGARTAAVSGACIEALAPADPGHVAITGAGLQARTHLAMLDGTGHRRVRVHARRRESADALRAWAADHVPALELTCVESQSEAVTGAGVVITAVPIGVEGTRLDPAQVRSDALLLPLDYATSVGAEIAAIAHLYADDVGQLLRYREAGAFPRYPDPAGFCGAAIRAPRPDGVVVCQNLGNGAADLVFADHVLRAALARGTGVQLRR
jgi:ornithine cyclodeaminase/alanine dehydrogenase-like protein (mu-crystallin family)